MIGGWRGARKPRQIWGSFCVLRDLVSQNRVKSGLQKISQLCFLPRGHVQLFPRILFSHHNSVSCVSRHQRTNNDEKIFNFDRRTGFDPADVFETKFYLFSFNISGGSEPGIRTGLSLRELRHEGKERRLFRRAAPKPPEHAAPTSHRTLGRRELAEHYAHVHRATARRTSSFDTPPPSRDMASRDVLAPRDANLDPFSVPGAVPRAHPPKGAGGAKVITYSRRRNKAISAKNKERDDAAKLAEELDALAVATPEQPDADGVPQTRSSPALARDGGYDGPFDDSDSDCGGPGSVLKKAAERRTFVTRGERLAKSARNPRRDDAAVEATSRRRARVLCARSTASPSPPSPRRPPSPSAPPPNPRMNDNRPSSSALPPTTPRTTPRHAAAGLRTPRRRPHHSRDQARAHL